MVKAKKKKPNAQPTWPEMVVIIEKLSVDDQFTLIAGLNQASPKLLAAPWMQAWISRHAPEVVAIMQKVHKR